MQDQIKTEQQPNTISTAVYISILFLFACGIRIYLWQHFPHVIFLHEADGMGYISIARNIIDNFSISNATHFPPAYPAVIAVFSLITGNYESGARLASIVMGSGMVVPLYLACTYLMPVRAAFCAALFAACFGPFVDYSLQPISQATYMGLIAFGVWTGLRCVKAASLNSLALFSMTSVAIYLTRPEGILFFAINLPILIYAIFTQYPNSAQRLKYCGLVISSFFLPFLAYIVLLKRITGAWSISGKSGVTTIGVDASMKIVSGGKTYGEVAAGKAGLMDLVPNLSDFITTYLTQFGKFSTVVAASLPGIMFILAVIGCARLVYELFNKQLGDGMKALCLCWIFLSPLVILLPVMAFDKISVSTSYVLPFYMVLFCFSAKGIVWLEKLTLEWCGNLGLLPVKVRRNIPLAVIASLILSWYMYTPIYQWLASDEFQFMARQQNFLLRTTGRWFSSNSDKSAKLMARWSNIGYYGDRAWVGLADGSISEVTEYARQHGVSYIVIDSDAVPRRRPQLVALLNPSQFHPGLEPVYADEQFNTRVIIYRIN
jgi:4-amino-4-deoxy-L-arabinose transferase-like glycosyltransferase